MSKQTIFHTKTQKETEIMFNRVTDNITAFQMEAGVISKNLATTRAEAFLAYQEYCEEIGVETRRSSQFTQGMLRLAPKVKDGWIYKPKKERAWIGFGLKNREQQSIEQIEQMEQQNILSNFSQQENIKDKNAVLTVPTVPNDSQLKVISEESGLRHIEANNLVKAKRFRSKPGVLCQTIDHDLICAKEAEYSINGNRYCPTHFDDEKENLRKIGKTVCAEWAEEAA